MTKWLAPDTNFHLAYQSIDVVRPTKIVPDADGWLIAATVVRELDDREHKPVEQKSRDRAKREKSILGNVIERGEPLPTGAAVSFALSPADYRVYNLNSDVTDHRILGDLKLYNEQHPEDLIVVVSHDLSMRLQAAALGFVAIDPPSTLRLPDIPTTTELQLKKTQAKLAALEATVPQLKVAFCANRLDSSQFEVATALSSQEVETIIKDIVPDPRNTPLIQSFALSFDYNEKYDEQFRDYLGKLPAYMIAHDRTTHRTIEVCLELINDGPVPAKEIDLRLEFTPVGSLSLDKPRVSDPPVRPVRYPIREQSFGRLLTAAMMSPMENLNLNLARLNKQYEPKDSGPHLGTNRAGDAIVNYNVVKLAQRDEKRLNSFYLMLDDDFSGETIPIDYRIRAANAPGETTGRLYLSLTWLPGDTSTLPSFDFP